MSSSLDGKIKIHLQLENFNTSSYGTTQKESIDSDVNPSAVTEPSCFGPLKGINCILPVNVGATRTYFVGSRDTGIYCLSEDAGNFRYKRRFAFEHVDWVNHLVSIYRDKFIISCSNDTTIKLWKVKSFKENAESSDKMVKSCQTYSLHKDYVLRLGTSPGTPNRFYSLGLDKTIIAWDMETGKSTSELTLSSHSSSLDLKNVQLVFSSNNHNGSSAYSLAINNQGDLVAAGYPADKVIRVWDVRCVQSVGKLSGHLDNIRCLAFMRSDSLDAAEAVSSPVFENHDSMELQSSIVANDHSSERIVSGSSDGTIKLWDLRTMTFISSWEHHRGASVLSIKEDPVNKTCFYSSDSKGRVMQFNLEEEDSGKLVGVSRYESGIYDFNFTASEDNSKSGIIMATKSPHLELLRLEDKSKENVDPSSNASSPSTEFIKSTSFSVEEAALSLDKKNLLIRQVDLSQSFLTKEALESRNFSNSKHIQYDLLRGSAVPLEVNSEDDSLQSEDSNWAPPWISINSRLGFATLTLEENNLFQGETYTASLMSTLALQKDRINMGMYFLFWLFLFDQNSLPADEDNLDDNGKLVSFLCEHRDLFPLFFKPPIGKLWITLEQEDFGAPRPIFVIPNLRRDLAYARSVWSSQILKIGKELTENMVIQSPLTPVKENIFPTLSVKKCLLSVEDLISWVRGSDCWIGKILFQYFSVMPFSNNSYPVVNRIPLNISPIKTVSSSTSTGNMSPTKNIVSGLTNSLFPPSATSSTASASSNSNNNQRWELMGHPMLQMGKILEFVEGKLNERSISTTSDSRRKPEFNIELYVITGASAATVSQESGAIAFRDLQTGLIPTESELNSAKGSSNNSESKPPMTVYSKVTMMQESLQSLRYRVMRIGNVKTNRPFEIYFRATSSNE